MRRFGLYRVYSGSGVQEQSWSDTDTSDADEITKS